MRSNKTQFLSILTLLSLLPMNIQAITVRLPGRQKTHQPAVYVLNPKEETDPAMTAALIDSEKELQQKHLALKNKIREMQIMHMHSRVLPGCPSCEDLQVLIGQERIAKILLQTASGMLLIAGQNKPFQVIVRENKE